MGGAHCWLGGCAWHGRFGKDRGKGGASKRLQSAKSDSEHRDLEKSKRVCKKLVLPA